jgi:hypothetical protein
MIPERAIACERTIQDERANQMERTTLQKRAPLAERTMIAERANNSERTKLRERSWYEVWQGKRIGGRANRRAWRWRKTVGDILTALQP